MLSFTIPARKRSSTCLRATPFVAGLLGGARNVSSGTASERRNGVVHEIGPVFGHVLLLDVPLEVENKSLQRCRFGSRFSDDEHDPSDGTLHKNTPQLSQAFDLDVLGGGTNLFQLLVDAVDDSAEVLADGFCAALPDGATVLADLLEQDWTERGKTRMSLPFLDSGDRWSVPGG